MGEDVVFSSPFNSNLVVMLFKYVCLAVRVLCTSHQQQNKRANFRHLAFPFDQTYRETEHGAQCN